jgi:hypothetical protein
LSEINQSSNQSINQAIKQSIKQSSRLLETFTFTNMMTTTDTRIFCKLQGVSQRFKVICFHKHQYACFQELVQEIASMWDIVPATGTLLLVASSEDGEEAAALVEDVHHLRDGDKCIFVPTTTTTTTTTTSASTSASASASTRMATSVSQDEEPVQVHYPEEEDDDNDDEDSELEDDDNNDEDSELKDDDDDDQADAKLDDSDDDDDDSDDEPLTTLKNNTASTSTSSNTLPIGTKYFYKHGDGALYPVVVARVNCKKKHPLKGECCVKYDGLKGTAWAGYKESFLVKISDLKTHTRERELRYHKRMRVLLKAKAKETTTICSKKPTKSRTTTASKETTKDWKRAASSKKHPPKTKKDKSR